MGGRLLRGEADGKWLEKVEGRGKCVCVSVCVDRVKGKEGDGGIERGQRRRSASGEMIYLQLERTLD